MKTYEQIQLDVNVNTIGKDIETFREWINTPQEEIEPDFTYLYGAVCANEKITEADDAGVDNPAKGTRKPGNRAIRRKATAKANLRLKRIEPLTYSVIITRNGGVIHKGDTFSWSSEWKKIDSRNRRYNGKHICRDYIMDDVSSDVITDPYAYTADEETEIAEEHLHGDFSDAMLNQIIEANSKFNRMVEAWGEDDDYYDREEMAYAEIDRLKKEIATYKDFLGEFNLNKLFEKWLEENKKEDD